MNVLSFLCCFFLVAFDIHDTLETIDTNQSSFALETSLWYKHTRQVLQQLHQSVNATAARQCLANRHIVWMGDSTSRFQFMTLLHLLEFGRWSSPFIVSSDNSSQQHIDSSLCRDKIKAKKVDITTYYQQRVRTMQPHLWCDCCRSQNVLIMDRRRRKLHRKILKPAETWYYRNWERNLSQTFFFIYPTRGRWRMTHNGMRGHWRWYGTKVGNVTCPAGKCCGPQTVWEGNLTHVLDTVIADLQPTDLVLSRGWGPFTQPELDGVAQSKLVSSGKVHLIWKPYGMQRSRLPRDPRDVAALEYFQRLRWTIFDAYNITATLASSRDYYDVIHTFCYIYDVINIFFLQMLQCKNVLIHV
jgi:hypothetical protein